MRSAQHMIVPLPGIVLDFLIPVNIAFSLTILLVAVFVKNALEISTFPTLLLISTLFRLGLNVSTTRGILTSADAGEMVKKRHAACPTGRMGTGWDTAYAALFLCCDESAFVTGALLPVDGGMGTRIG